MESSCPFCARLQGEDLLAENELAVAFTDAFPLTPGHALIVPRRHEPDYFALSEAEQEAMWRLVPQVRGIIKENHRPDGFNIGLNAGEAAGQTIGHAHLHVIPRYKGDVEDPRGGIRWILPEKAPYWRD
jgi:diadenosine tetraphosphate (Ap4A) HIT family hydrolase